MRDIQADVEAFHRKFGHPSPGLPTPLDPETLAFRQRLIREEAEELCEALATGNPVKVGREMADLVYVAVGSGVNAGVPFETCWEAVHEANMEKQAPPLGSPRDTKPLKPEGWVSPNDRIAAALGALRRRSGRLLKLARKLSCRHEQRYHCGTNLARRRKYLQKELKMNIERGFLAGKKTYALSIVAIVLSWLGFSLGEPVLGHDATSVSDAVEMTITALLAMTFRHGMSTTVQQATSELQQSSKPQTPQVVDVQDVKVALEAFAKSLDRKASPATSVQEESKVGVPK
jgi:predicted HAD superfamily Cof-like phosphohydrolase